MSDGDHAEVDAFLLYILIMFVAARNVNSKAAIPARTAAVNKTGSEVHLALMQ